MRRVLPPLAVAALGLLAVLLLPRGDDGSRRATVVRAVDGDTVAVAVGGRVRSVRLLGIDTPETHRPGTAVECGGPEASASMAALVPPGTSVALEADPGQDRVDRYGRLLAYLRLPGGRLVQEEQLAAGWAKSYVFEGRPVSRYAAFRRAEARARAARRGVWRLCGGRFHSSGP
jgi:micrococcal nuclease